jgi:hypothetical protein
MNQMRRLRIFAAAAAITTAGLLAGSSCSGPPPQNCPAGTHQAADLTTGQWVCAPNGT